jgi:hypothetical protein
MSADGSFASFASSPFAGQRTSLRHRFFFSQRETQALTLIELREEALDFRS